MKENLYLYPNIVKARKSKMTQRELAELIGISQQEVSRYENGEVKAPINYIIDVANVCNVSVDYILGRTVQPACASELSELFDKLSHDNKIRVIERMQTLLDIQENEKK